MVEMYALPSFISFLLIQYIAHNSPFSRLYLSFPLTTTKLKRVLHPFGFIWLRSSRTCSKSKHPYEVLETSNQFVVPTCVKCIIPQVGHLSQGVVRGLALDPHKVKLNTYFSCSTCPLQSTYLVTSEFYSQNFFPRAP